MWNGNQFGSYMQQQRQPPPIPGQPSVKPEPIDWNLVSVLDPIIIQRVKDYDSLQKLITNFVCASFVLGNSKVLIHPLSIRLCQLLQIGFQMMNNGQEELKRIIAENEATVSKQKVNLKKMKHKLSKTEETLKAKSIPYDKCPACGKKFKSLEYVDKHIINKHKELSDAWEIIRGRKDPANEPELQKVLDEIARLKESIRNQKPENLFREQFPQNQQYVDSDSDEDNDIMEETSRLMNEKLTAAANDLGRSMQMWEDQRNQFNIFNKPKKFVPPPSVANPLRPFFVEAVDIQEDKNDALNLFGGNSSTSDEENVNNEIENNSTNPNESELENEVYPKIPFPKIKNRLIAENENGERIFLSPGDSEISEIKRPKDKASRQKLLRKAAKFINRPTRNVLETAQKSDIENALFNVQRAKERESRRIASGVCGSLVTPAVVRKAVALNNADYAELRDYIKGRLEEAYPLANDDLMPVRPPRLVSGGRVRQVDLELVRTGALPGERLPVHNDEFSEQEQKTKLSPPPSKPKAEISSPSSPISQPIIESKSDTKSEPKIEIQSEHQNDEDQNENKKELSKISQESSKSKRKAQSSREKDDDYSYEYYSYSYSYQSDSPKHQKPKPKDTKPKNAEPKNTKPKEKRVHKERQPSPPALPVPKAAEAIDRLFGAPPKSEDTDALISDLLETGTIGSPPPAKKVANEVSIEWESTSSSPAENTNGARVEDTAAVRFDVDDSSNGPPPPKADLGATSEVEVAVKESPKRNIVVVPLQRQRSRPDNFYEDKSSSTIESGLIQIPFTESELGRTSGIDLSSNISDFEVKEEKSRLVEELSDISFSPDAPKRKTGKAMIDSPPRMNPVFRERRRQAVRASNAEGVSVLLPPQSNQSISGISAIAPLSSTKNKLKEKLPSKPKFAQKSPPKVSNDVIEDSVLLMPQLDIAPSPKVGLKPSSSSSSYSSFEEITGISDGSFNDVDFDLSQEIAELEREGKDNKMDSLDELAENLFSNPKKEDQPPSILLGNRHSIFDQAPSGSVNKEEHSILDTAKRIRKSNQTKYMKEGLTFASNGSSLI